MKAENKHPRPAWVAKLPWNTMPEPEEQAIEPAVLKRAIRRVTCQLELVPVIGGSAFKKKGVQPLVDAIIDYLPSPLDVPAMEAHPVDDLSSIVPVEADDDQGFCGLAFKLWTDPFVGKLVFFRVYRGTLKKGSTVLNTATGKKERISRGLMIQADKRTDVDAIYSGDIAAIVGVRKVATGHTICSQKSPIMLEPPTFPAPGISMAIAPRPTKHSAKPRAPSPSSSGTTASSATRWSREARAGSTTRQQITTPSTLLPRALMWCANTLPRTCSAYRPTGCA